MRRWPVSVLVTIVLCVPGLFADELDRPGQVHVGEKLDPAGYGPGVIEHMDEVLARDRARAAEVAEKLKGRDAEAGVWAIPTRGATDYPYSGEHNVANKWGDPCMAITFPVEVDVHGAYFAGQGGAGVWSLGLRIIGYRHGAEVQTTDWFRDIGAGAVWFEADLRGVDRIVIESSPSINGRGWYAMDDLAYTPVGAAGGPEPATVVVDFEDTNYKQTLSGSGYAGLIWETGPGDFSSAEGVPAPRIAPGFEEEAPTGPGEGSALRGGAGTLPDLLQDFIGIKRGDGSSSSYPPDTCGAVGPDHFVEVINRVIAAYDKDTGTRVWISNLGSFLPGSNGDPRVLYDQHSGRWIVIVTDFSTRIYLAVSLTSDPTGSWFKTNFTVSQESDAGKFPDYPTLGVDADGIYTAAFMVGGANRMTIFAIDKAPLIAPGPSLGTVTAFRELPWEGAIQPVHTYGNPGGEHFVSRRSSTSVRVRQLTGPLTAPTLTELGNATIPSHSSPPDAPALGSSTDLDTVGHRLMNAVYRDDSIWTAHTVSVSGRAACRWYELDVSGTPSLVQSGTVSDNSLYFFFPGITVSARGDVVMGFTGSKATQYAGAYYTGRTVADAAGEMAVPVQYKAGLAPQNNIDGYGRNRWGDYSLTTLDPDDELTMWTIQEYGHGTNIWGTWIARLSLFSDCNSNGVNDPDDITAGTSLDCNNNIVPDECESDCNGNDTPDECDITAGTSLDCQPNGTPDECETTGNDCNGNTTPDECDITAGTSQDCQPNGTPDECELAGNDCNGNTTPDECEVDCNVNSAPDDCDITSGASVDCTSNGTPDECEMDCNTNGVRDDCDIASGTSDDCNTNGWPDECDVAVCESLWGGFTGFVRFTPMSSIDAIPPGGDGVFWDNPLGTAFIERSGCETGGVTDMSVLAYVDQDVPAPTDGYVDSEWFQTDAGALPPERQAYSLSFKAKVGVANDSETDWEISVRDATNAQRVAVIRWSSTVSTTTGFPGSIVVQDPAPASTFTDTGVSIAVGTCHAFEVALNNLDDTVKVYIDGELKVATTRFQADARRMDYFRVQPAPNGASSNRDTQIQLDAFDLCVTGVGVSPAEFPDCDGNGVPDACEPDCDGNGVPEACERGDSEPDGDVDLTDYDAFEGCYSGPDGGPLGGGCEVFDFDCDDDIDLDDFARFQGGFTG